MAKRTSKTNRKTKARRFQPLRWLRRWLFRLFLVVAAVVLLAVAAYRVINPPVTIYMMQEKWRLGTLDRQWVPLEGVAPVMARSVVAAEDANFCQHWGFDMSAIRDAIADGGTRGASTLSQQVVKNVYLWHGRSWPRKALEAAITPLVEAIWPKRRIIEVYLNVAEFDEGVFGVEAAARHYFGVGPEALTPVQAARLAAVLPAPKDRNAARPSRWLRTRAAGIMDGAATIRRDGRAACFED
ncbi:monofunctional biosynthetic peptidoglycan transglycosylase [Roseovarius sp. A21]|uniref:Biosynthetic peptidoglycan transglycosylase n=1 Tax=Roseovarius bejariae TaxID=2576383 RepID=A0A844CLT1_9RHOB|nr:monofunctional biosynthetic peptidoglycan transglycosylase [Roseovarius bejariae]MRU15592.1 monofunctional biosynthetic peptidoglycan transglycosylase [Roseovarius bejariae]